MKEVEEGGNTVLPCLMEGAGGRRAPWGSRKLEGCPAVCSGGLSQAQPCHLLIA